MQESDFNPYTVLLRMKSTPQISGKKYYIPFSQSLLHKTDILGIDEVTLSKEDKLSFSGSFRKDVLGITNFDIFDLLFWKFDTRSAIRCPCRPVQC